jgi:hypothetical protein
MQWGHEEWAVIACLDPDAYAAAEYNTSATESDFIDMSKWSEVMFILMAGTLGSSATLDLDIESGATTAANTSTLKSITQLTQAGTDSDKQVIVSVKSEELPAGHRYLNGEMTVGTATSDCGLLVLGRAVVKPATDNDLASVDEVVT